MTDDEKIIELFFERSEQGIRELDTKYIEEALHYKKKAKKTVWEKGRAMAACLAVMFFIGVCVLTSYFDQQDLTSPDNPTMTPSDHSTIALSDNSTNVIARYIDEAPATSTNMDLQLLTEEEVFSTSDMAIFKGIVLEIRNIELDFSGVKEYRAIAQIEVKEVLQGPCKAGETVSVLLPCPISEDIWVEDTDVISSMKAGMTGIFMPVLYNDENSIWKQNHACLVKKDIAEYGFLDGVQYAFLETENGLVFSRETYESIADVTTLNKVEEYIQTMIQRS